MDGDDGEGLLVVPAQRVHVVGLHDERVRAVLDHQVGERRRVVVLQVEVRALRQPDLGQHERAEV